MRPTTARPGTVGAHPVHSSSAKALSNPAFWLVLLLVVAYGLLFGWLSLERYWTFQMHALDMGNMGQAAWNTVHGHPFRFTDMRLPYFGIEAWGTTTRLSFHVEALYPVIALVYLIYPHPESLLILQTVALALGALPCYWLARRVLGNDWLGALFAALYLLHPTLEGMNLYEFHPVALATPLLLFAFWFMYDGRPIPFVLCGLAAMGTKEELGLVVALFGLYGALFLRERKAGVGIAAVGVFWSLFATVVVEHHFRQPGTLTYLHTRYAWLLGPKNHALSHALHVLAHHPDTVFQVLFVWPKLAYLERLFAPAGYLSLLSPALLVLALPTLLLNLFSQDFHMYSGLGQDSAEIVSVAMIAAVFGARVLAVILQRAKLPPRSIAYVLGGYLLVQGLLYQRSDGFTPLGSRFQIPAHTRHTAVQQRFVDMIPSAVPVSTQDQLEPALSSRANVYLFEDLGGRSLPGVPDAQYVLLDASTTTYPLPSYQLYDSAQSLLRHGWHIEAADDGLILLRPGAGRTAPPARFYSFATSAQGGAPMRPRLRYHGVELVAARREELDQPNHPIPTIQYAVTMIRGSGAREEVEPVVFETLRGRPIACSADPFGLPWLPSSRWARGRRYTFAMRAIETNTNDLGTAHFEVELTHSLSHDPAARDCGRLWSHHGQLADLGTLDLRP